MPPGIPGRVSNTCLALAVESVSVTGLSKVRYVEATVGGEFFIAHADGGAWTLSHELQ